MCIRELRGGEVGRKIFCLRENEGKENGSRRAGMGP
jgi:hypothetical protein